MIPKTTVTDDNWQRISLKLRSVDNHNRRLK